MIVEHSRLYTVDPAHPTAHYEYSNQVEAACAKLLGFDNIDQPPGYHPEYDFENLNTGLTYELKCRRPGKEDNFPRVEFKQSSSKRPSGVQLTTADYWIFISYQAGVGKVRALELTTVKRMYQYFLDGSLPYNAFASPNDNFFRIDTFRGIGTNHIWLGDIAANMEQGTYDLSKWSRKNNNPGIVWTSTRPKRAPSKNPFPNRTDNI
jgi:hypothetical protein